MKILKLTQSESEKLIANIFENIYLQISATFNIQIFLSN